MRSIIADETLVDFIDAHSGAFEIVKLSTRFESNFGRDADFASWR